jgi:hypothetical protein
MPYLQWQRRLHIDNGDDAIVTRVKLEDLINAIAARATTIF